MVLKLTLSRQEEEQLVAFAAEAFPAAAALTKIRLDSGKIQGRVKAGALGEVKADIVLEVTEQG